MNGRTYDALGRQTSAGADSFTWDAGSRLTRYTVDGVTVVNVYDALGRRIRRTSAGISSAYVWNDALGLASISVERRAGVVFRFFIHTPEGELLYTIDAATNARRYYHYEETGNTIFVTNQAGNVIASYAYTPFGQLTASTGTLDNPFTWQGERGVMTEPGDHYYVRSRYYDGADGRFLSRDPIGAMGPKTINPYQYALANPLLFVDPSGGVSIRLQLEVTNARRMVLVARQRLKRTRAKADQAAHVARVAQAYLSPKVAQPAVDHAALLARFVQEDLRTLAARLRARDAAERASRMALNAERANKKSSGVQLQTHIPDVFSSGFYEIAGLPLISLEMEQTLLKKLNRSKKESNIKHLREILDAARRQAETGGTRTRSQQDALNKDVRNAEAAFEAAGGIISVVPELVPIVVLN